MLRRILKASHQAKTEKLRLSDFISAFLNYLFIVLSVRWSYHSEPTLIEGAIRPKCQGGSETG